MIRTISYSKIVAVLTVGRIVKKIMTATLMMRMVVL